MAAVILVLTEAVEMNGVVGKGADTVIESLMIGDGGEHATMRAAAMVRPQQRR